MILDEATRKAIQDENDRKSIRLDTKQHCLKILQGIGKFDDNTPHRAIWELVQNARDLSIEGADGRKHVNIRIELSDEELIFAHDGKHFNYDSLSSLIKQVSSEEKEDPNAAGQFGTGFMTTHKFSRIIYINGSYEVKPGIYVSLERFKIDRSANELSPMRDAMTEQLIEVNKLLEKDTSEKSKWTEFIYTADNADRKDAARKGVQAAMDLMPYVMVINECIESCCIKNSDGISTLFKKEQVPDEAGLHVTRIWKNDSPIDCFYLQSEDKRDIVFLPLSKATVAQGIGSIPRLFIYFPLLGTELIDNRFIFHSERFYPTEPRDLIVLPDGNIENKSKADTDVSIIQSMSEMLFAYLRTHVTNIKNSIYLAPIGFNINIQKEKTKDYFAELHTEWVNVFRDLPLIELEDGCSSISQSEKVKVLDHSIVEFLQQEGNDKYLDVVYDYASKVSALPRKQEVLEWSDIVYKWDSEKSEWFITVEDIVNKISEQEDKSKLLEFLMYLKDSGQSSYFSSKSIIPNREGTLCSISKLRNGKNIPDNLYEVIKPLVPDFTQMLVDPAYVGVYDEWVAPTRDDLKTALSSFVSSEEMKDEPYKESLPSVLSFCMTFPTQNTTNTRYQAMSVISRFHDTAMTLNYVPHLGDVDKEQLMYNVVFDSLVKWQFMQIESFADKDSEWYGNNAEIHLELLTALSSKERLTSYQKVMQDYAIFPNMNGKLCKWDTLHVLSDRDDYKDEDIADLCLYYKNVVGKDIKDRWVDLEFSWMQTFTEDKAKENLARPIDDCLQEGNYRSEVTLEIIKHLDKNEQTWIDWFGNINKNKAEIFLHRIDDTDLPHVYTILKEKEKIAPLAELASDPKMNEIIEAGRNVVAQREYEARHNEFIKELGEFVEKLLLEELQTVLDDEQLHIEVCDEQGGQDYKVWLGGEVVYYVEVKSRWCTSDSVEMSALQFKTSVEQKNCYSLCVVDMTWKGTENIENREYGDLEICKAHTKVLHDIGQRNEWCLDSVKETNDRTHIGGSYSLIVPQSIVKADNIPGFDSLIDKIKNAIHARL